jgi:uncharacterized membrane protein
MGGLPAAEAFAVQQGAEMSSNGHEPVEQQPDPLEPETGGGRVSLRLLAGFFIGAGVNHFVIPRAYEQIVPPRLRGHAKELVQISGVAEIAGGLGVLIPATRRLSGLGLIALLAAVFPANVYMAREPQHFRKIPRWALYARLPLQPLMVLWAWRTTRR